MGQTLSEQDVWHVVKRKNSRPLNTKCPRKQLPKKEQFYDSNNNLIIKIKGRNFIYPPKAGVIMFNKNLDKVLVVKNNYASTEELSKLGLPKGHLYKEESFQKCAEREFYEETGLKISIPADRQFIKVNNSKYFPFCTDISNLNSLVPIDTEEISNYQIVGEDESDIKQNKISISSPIARSSIGRSAGETLTIPIPKGKIEVEITDVEFIN